MTHLAFSFAVFCPQTRTSATVFPTWFPHVALKSSCWFKINCHLLLLCASLPSTNVNSTQKTLVPCISATAVNSTSSTSQLWSDRLGIDARLWVLQLYLMFLHLLCCLRFVARLWCCPNCNCQFSICITPNMSKWHFDASFWQQCCCSHLIVATRSPW